MSGTATFHALLQTMASVSCALGRSADAAHYAGQAAATRETILAALYNPATATFDRGSQCANAMGLALGLAPEADRQRVLDNLVRDIRSRGNHVSAGDIGFHYVVRALGDAGRGDVLIDLLRRNDDPSYGAQIARGATTLTEAWDASRHASQNHFMLGHIERWFYGGLVGISVDCAAMDAPAIRIAPQPPEQLGYANARYRSVFGTIAVRWSRDRAGITYDIEIPVGGRARVVLPARPSDTVTERGKPLVQTRKLSLLGRHGGAWNMDVGSGRYHFAVGIG